MKPGTEVRVVYTGKLGVVVSNKGDTVVVKVGDRVMYFKKTEVSAT